MPWPPRCHKTGPRWPGSCAPWTCQARGYKISLAWLGEKAARLKLNGRLTVRSPLSLVEELELLRLGVEGKAAGWRTLRARADADTRLDQAALDRLITRARSQADLLEDLRVQAASDAFS